MEPDPETGEFTPEIGHNSGFVDRQEQDVDDALHSLHDNIETLAIAAGNRVYAEQYRKALKAILENEVKGTPEGKTLGDRETYAYSHPRMLEHLEKQRKWEIEFWRANGTNTHAKEVISVYKTRCANSRPANKF